MNEMIINDLKCQINMPDAPEGDGVHQLPPYDRQEVYVVDDYLGCPDNWMHGSSKAASYFLPIRKGKHLWLDFNMNAGHTHDVAVMLSVQGVNPITGQRTTRLELEQYENKCPVHDVDFGQDKFCEKCGHKWPAQNYMSTTYVQRGLMWIDGWRNGSGTVCGFLITDEVVRGIAKQLIGEDRVFAIGVAFYLSRTPKPLPKPIFIGNMAPSKWNNSGGIKKRYMYEPSAHWVGDDALIGSSGTELDNKGPSASYQCSTGQSRGIVRTASLATREEPTAAPIELQTKFEIGGGAQIAQAQFDSADSNRLSYYDSTPAGLIYINYCSDGDFKKIMKAGKRAESFLGALKVGN